jgi:molybdopterin-guanine dinucleotide biosynthesis protein A
MGADKALMELEGEPMFVRAARTLGAVADPVVLARGPRELPNLGWPQIDDAAPDSGPLGGLIASLRWSPHELLAVVAADMPFISTGLFDELVEVWDGQDAVVPFNEDGTQPLHALYARSSLGHLERKLGSGRLSLRGAVEEMSVLMIDGRKHDRFGANVNRPEDLGLLDLRKHRARDL